MRERSVFLRCILVSLVLPKSANILGEVLQGRNRTIEVSVAANAWPTTVHSPLCETWAYLVSAPSPNSGAVNRTKDDEGWAYLDALTSRSSHSLPTSYSDAIDLAIEVASKTFLGPPVPFGDTFDRRLLRYSLALRSHSPMCEMHRVLARDAALAFGLYTPGNGLGREWNLDAFAVLQPDGIASDDPNVIVRSYFEDRSENLSGTFDVSEVNGIILPEEKARFGQPGKKVVVVYGNVGTLSFASFYAVLADANINFVVRHMGPIDYEENVPNANETTLQGYGVRLDIKNSEAFDDKHASGDDHKETVPSVKLSLQAATVISEASDPLSALQDVSQNLPSLVSSLVSISVPEGIANAAATLENSSVIQKLKHSSGNTDTFGFYVNGRQIAMDEHSGFNLFNFVNLLREENALIQKLSSRLGPLLSFSALRAVQKALEMGRDSLASHGQVDDASVRADAKKDVTTHGSQMPRVDLYGGSRDAVIYLNDIERDPQYQDWPSGVQNFVFATTSGATPTVKRNLFTILAVIDPLLGVGSTGLNLAIDRLEAKWPIRLGVLIVNEGDIEACRRDEGETGWEECTYPEVKWDDSVAPAAGELKRKAVTTGVAHKLFAHVVSHYGGMTGLTYLVAILDAIAELKMNEREISLDDFINRHSDILVNAELITSAAEARAEAIAIIAQNIEGEVISYGNSLRFAVFKMIKPGMSFLNGLPLPPPSLVDTQFIPEVAKKILLKEQDHAAGLIASGVIGDHGRKVSKAFFRGDGVFWKYQPDLMDNLFHPLVMENENSFIDIYHDFDESSLLFPQSHVDGVGDREDGVAVFVIDAYFELDTFDGLTLLSNFLSMMASFPSSIGEDDGRDRISIAYRVLPRTASCSQFPLSSLLRFASQFDPSTILLVVEAFRDNLEHESGSSLEPSVVIKEIPEIDDNARGQILALIQNMMAKDSSQGSYLFSQTLPADDFLTVNGRLYTPLDNMALKSDLLLLLSLEICQARALTRLMRPHISEDGRFLYDSIGKVAALLGSHFSSEPSRRTDVEFQLELLNQNDPLYFIWNDDPVMKSTQTQSERQHQVKVTAILDPLSEPNRRLAPILHVLRDQLKVPLHVILTPRTVFAGGGTHLNSYYRFVLDPSASPDGLNPKAYFSNLPTSHIYTVNMDVPEPWSVQQVHAVHDTDNLRCDSVHICGDDATLSANLTKVEYKLSGLLFTGQCYEARTSTPPSGLQLTLAKYSASLFPGSHDAAKSERDSFLSTTSSHNDSHYSDTLVMKTGGYWQLKAQPGIWKLGIAKRTNGPEIFEVVDGVMQNGLVVVNSDVCAACPSESKMLIMKDFVSHEQLFLVDRKNGYENAEIFGNMHEIHSTDEIHEKVINVFSLATGHTYERLLKIMMLSVTKRTSSPVKFWFLENFLSPNFKVSASALASQIGCEVEFVTYKWPAWLRHQNDKRRIIWGYKILFLDVLFPLNIQKVIFVDADQVMRADLKELWNLDLQGAPYGYTPFCNSRKETQGYQFWNSGFWKNALEGKPYHISALYVVDLNRFRQEQVGDKLREIYQQLSSDKDALANLDQDLPNFAQSRGVRIHSLPQEWLWCESWCSDETKAFAKSIDLCNNPLKEESKLSMAKRIISGDLFQESWVELDSEVMHYEQESALKSQVDAMATESMPQCENNK